MPSEGLRRMANKDRNKRSARKARAAERAVREAAQEAAAPSSKASAQADKTKASTVSKMKAKVTGADVESPKKEDAKKAASKKTGIVARVKNYFGDVRTEMRRVTWPSKEELKNYSMAVTVMLVIFGVAIWVIDTGVVAGFAGLVTLRG
jgi:preprotein translocase subunit SecE